MAALVLIFAAPPAMAQGFPGGKGGGGRGGGMRPSSGNMSRPNPSAEQSAPSPLAAFSGELHALREELLVRDDQADAWASMRDALHTYVDLESQANNVMRTASTIDPLQRIRNLADDSRARADALAKVSESINALTILLDERQRETFGLRLADAFAAGNQASNP